MKEILIFAGTTEGRKLSECLVAAGIPHTTCVATEYGEIVMTESELCRIHCGRMNAEEIRAFLQNGDYGAVVDATHPYADIVTANIKEAMAGMEIPYLRMKREVAVEHSGKGVTFFATNEECARALEETKGNILLTTGSKELATYCVSDVVRERLYVRILPGIENLLLCQEHGIQGKQILALQGPFSTAMNEAMLRQYQIQCLVTKASGRNGGYLEKLEAAERVGIPVYVIGHESADEGLDFNSVCEQLEALCGRPIKVREKMEIVLAGIGMGSRENLTVEVRTAIDNADVLLGAERMLAPYQPRVEKKPYYLAEQIIPYIQELQRDGYAWNVKSVVILFSGDSGFYSGAQGMYRALQEAVEAGSIQAKIRILPGISSVAYLASCIGESWQDAKIMSMHGRKVQNLARTIAGCAKLFLLLSGGMDIVKLGEQLLEAGLEHCQVIVGDRLSYPQQAIHYLTPQQCRDWQEEGLYICCIRNSKAEYHIITPGLSDSAFLRDKVPMTKEEVREVSICKLQLHQGAVLYDIGSGTGSIAVEAAGLSEQIQVYALEYKQEALELIQKNKEQFRLENLEIIAAKAPEGLDALPKATHAFIGGSGGRMKEILDTLYGINPSMRVVINAISMETISELKEIVESYPIAQEDIMQMQVSRARRAGAYHLMQAENPVWICSFRFVQKSNEAQECE